MNTLKDQSIVVTYHRFDAAEIRTRYNRLGNHFLIIGGH